MMMMRGKMMSHSSCLVPVFRVQRIADRLVLPKDERMPQSLPSILTATVHHKLSAVIPRQGEDQGGRCLPTEAPEGEVHMSVTTTLLLLLLLSSLWMVYAFTRLVWKLLSLCRRGE